MRWTWGRFDTLSGSDVYDLLALRSAVFVVEQDCVFLDADGLDRQSWHLLGRDASGTLVAYLRCLDPGLKYREPSIGRVTVTTAMRRTGLGRMTMAEGIARVGALWPDLAIRINAQHRLEAFYASFGFTTEGPIYDEDGIDHVEMTLAPAAASHRNTTTTKEIVR